MADYIGGFDKTLLNLAQSNQNNKRAAQKDIMDLLKYSNNQKTKKNQAIQLDKDKKALVSGFKKIHPKTTANLTDEEIYLLGDKINSMHNDKTPMKFKDSFTDEDGNKIGVFYDGSIDDKGNPAYKNVVMGKAKDYQSGKKDDTGETYDPLSTKNFDPKKVKSKSGRKYAKDLGFDLDKVEDFDIK